MYNVLKCSQGTRQVMMTGTEEECNSFCSAFMWLWIDDNGFAWELDMEVVQ